jgi:preprotein translocase subunit SecG
MDLLVIVKYGAAISAAGIVVVVLLQARSGGLGAVLGGSGGGGVYRAKRGLEAVMYNLTIVFGVLFAIFSIGVAILSV